MTSLARLVSGRPQTGQPPVVRVRRLPPEDNEWCGGENELAARRHRLRHAVDVTLRQVESAASEE
jgi:hypothetical protein